MNKLKKLLLAIVLVALLAAPVWAAGTVTITSSAVTVQGDVWRKVITLSWVADAAEATVPPTTITAVTYGIGGWYLYTAETNPGSTAPTDDYDMVLNDADGLDVAGGLLTNRDAIATEIVSMGTSAHGYPAIRGDLTFVLSDNSVNSATGTLILIFVAN